MLALGTFLATVIGVGMFGLPAVAERSGFVPFVVALLVIAPLVLVLHERFTEMILGTPERDRIPGYVGRYLGTPWKRVGIIVSSAGMLGALLAYLIVGGAFVQLLVSAFAPISLPGATALFFLAGTLLIALGVRSVASLDVLLMALFFVITLVLLVIALPHFTTAYVATQQWRAAPFSYGIILFSLWGLSLVPETAELAGRNRGALRGVIGIGLAITVVLYILFTVTVLGVTGPATTADALSGFLAATDARWTLLAALFGFIATFTSYISLGLNLKQTLQLDGRFSTATALGAVAVIPAALYGLGAKNFLAVIGFTGAILLGIEAMLVTVAGEAFRRQRKRAVRWWSALLLIALLLLGMGIEVWTALDGGL